MTFLPLLEWVGNVVFSAIHFLVAKETPGVSSLLVGIYTASSLAYHQKIERGGRILPLCMPRGVNLDFCHFRDSGRPGIAGKIGISILFARP